MTSIRRLLRSVFFAIAVTAVSVTATLVGAGSASASLSPGSGWTQATLPSGFFVLAGVPAPVSCVTGTQFCVAIVFGTTAVHADVVTTDGGQHWTGYTDLPAAIGQYNGISCASTSVCWVTGEAQDGSAAVAETTDGGQTWTDMSPSQWGINFMARSIDCVTTTTCWLVGWNQNLADPSLGDTPWVVDTTDGGATWTTFSNLPSVPQTNPNGTYQLYAISCISALNCVAAGGLNGSDGQVQVISTADGGATWARSTDPTLQGLQEVFSLSCLPTDSGLPSCYGVGAALQAAGPVEVTSTDGGATWNGMETYDNTGWFSSISCGDTQHCWAAGAGTAVALAGTADGGGTWSVETAETTNENGVVSCPSASLCVTTADNAVWITTNGGGIGAAPASRPIGTMSARAGLDAAHKPATRRLPRVSGRDVWARTGRSVTLTGQYTGSTPASTATATITLPTGSKRTRSVPIGLNRYFSTTIGAVAPGNTKVVFTVAGAISRRVLVHSHAGVAPSVAALSVHAGPVGGGNTLTITGTNFSRVKKVLFGATPGTRVAVSSATKLTVRAPAGTGARYVTVVTSGGGPSALTGHAVYNWLKRPSLTRLRPGSGRPAGGTKVTITGTNLAFVRSVRFGASRGRHLVVISPTEITVVTPPGHGTVNVRITTAGGTSALVKADRYTY
jgi:hypothetical protein